MSNDAYLMRLGTRLATGLSRMDVERKQRHRDFILSQQMPDGGFRGREGDSDLYYTGFAVRSLVCLGGFSAAECETISGYVRSFISSGQWKRLNVIDLNSWLYTALAVQLSGGGDLLVDLPELWVEELLGNLETLRTDDGGYAKTTEGAAGSTYHSFLVTLTYQLLGRAVPKRNTLIQFLYDRQRDDGGFVEIAPMKRSGTNPTAAAVALLMISGTIDSEIRDDVRAFLRDVRSGEGGFQANTRIPFADGLSTFTGLLTTQDLQLGEIIPSQKIERFLGEWLEFPTGGFRGASWDENADTEYTFYGLGILGLLWSRDNSGQARGSAPTMTY